MDEQERIVGGVPLLLCGRHNPKRLSGLAGDYPFVGKPRPAKAVMLLRSWT
jgi:hypothetical protein